MGKYDEFKWSKKDNEIAKLEVKLSQMLTEELNARPAVNLPLLMISTKVRARINPTIFVLKSLMGRTPKIMAESWRESNGTRKVIVSVT